ncbi:MAG: hypothetical protein QOH19_1616 [Actinomycetota bacterium]|nr:hypothetical protein [Actinomycetota bacterium]
MTALTLSRAGVNAPGSSAPATPAGRALPSMSVTACSRASQAWITQGRPVRSPQACRPGSLSTAPCARPLRPTPASLPRRPRGPPPRLSPSRDRRFARSGIAPTRLGLVRRQQKRPPPENGKRGRLRRASFTPAGRHPESTFQGLVGEARPEFPAPWRDAILDCIDRPAVIGTPIAEYVPDKLVKGRVALVGDASHVPAPMTGSGFGASLHDAGTLAAAIAAHAPGPC